MTNEALAITPLESDDIIAPEELPPISPANARLVYNMLMSGMIARLLLYLFGEFDKDDVEMMREKIAERRTVFDQIVLEKKPPLRAVYDFLVEHKFIEAQVLIEEAWIFIDQPDTLQARIVHEEEQAVLCDAEQPTGGPQ